ncbi:NepR family anti-sigma factor [Paracoccus sp. (in: a-proteobacteria)]
MEQQIDENLKRVYDQDVNEQVPDRFLDLLRQLKEQD